MSDSSTFRKSGAATFSRHPLLALKSRNLSIPHSHGFRMGEGSLVIKLGTGDGLKPENTPRLISTWLPWSTVPSGN
jgi:hypothetical protein